MEPEVVAETRHRRLFTKNTGLCTVAAHPRAASRQRRLVPDEIFARMTRAGLAALEVDHRDHGPAQRE